MSNERIDVFLSYTHQNDCPPPGIQTGWVTTLKQHLEAALRLKLPRPGPQVFLDHQLTEGTSFERQLLEKIRAARTMVLALSPAYVGSPWCNRELANVLIENERSGREGNVFVVEIDQVDPQQRPRKLDELLAIRFWQEDSESHIRETLGFPVPTPDDREYHRLVNRLAHRIAERLAMDASGPSTVKQKPVVYVAEATDDLMRKRGQIVELVEAEGFQVVPAADLPRDCTAAFVDALGRELSRATLYVQLLGPEQGRSPPDGSDSFVRLQADAARGDEAGRRLRTLQWRDLKLSREDVEDAAYRELVFGGHVQASRLEEFKLEVLRDLRGFAVSGRTNASEKSGPPRENGKMKLYVKADGVDRDLGDEVAETLKRLDVIPERSPACDGRGAFAQALAEEASMIATCDGVLMVYGRSTPSWLNSTYMYTARAMGLKRIGIWGAVLDAPPSDKPGVPVKSRNLVTLGCRAGLRAEVLDEFVKTLRHQRIARG